MSALVYQRHQHYINLFMWPAPKDHDQAVHVMSQRGYNLLHADGADGITAIGPRQSQ